MIGTETEYIIVRNCTENQKEQFIDDNFIVLDYNTDDLSVEIGQDDVILLNNFVKGDIKSNYNLSILDNFDYKIKNETITYYY